MKPFKENLLMTNSNIPIKLNLSNETLVKGLHPHYHEEIEILYFIEGKAKEQIDDNIFLVEKGDLIIIGRDKIHSTYSYENLGCDILVMIANLNNLCKIDSSSYLNYKISSFCDSTFFPNPIKTESGIGKEFLNLIMEIKNSIEKESRGNLLNILACFYKIMALSLDNFREYKEKNRVNIKEKDALMEIFKMINSDYNNDLTLIEAAKISNFSIAHFSRIFKKSTGMTFKEYLLFSRVNRACILLNSQISIEEVARQCGFNSQTSFIRNFRKYKNQTPSSFRNSRWKNL